MYCAAFEENYCRKEKWISSSENYNSKKTFLKPLNIYSNSISALWWGKDILLQSICVMTMIIVHEVRWEHDCVVHSYKNTCSWCCQSQHTCQIWTWNRQGWRIYSWPAADLPSSLMSSGERTMGAMMTMMVRQNFQMFMTGSAATCRNPSMLAFTSRISNIYSSKT